MVVSKVPTPTPHSQPLMSGTHPHPCRTAVYTQEKNELNMLLLKPRTVPQWLGPWVRDLTLL